MWSISSLVIANDGSCAIHKGVSQAHQNRTLPNGTHPEPVKYQNVGSLYMNETFPEEWFRRAMTYSLASTGANIVTLPTSSSEITVPGQNNFVPLGIDLSNVSPNTATCSLASAVFDETPGFLTPALADHADVVFGFLNGAVKPFFAPSNCPILSKDTQPGPNASNDTTPGVPTTCDDLEDGVYTC